MPTIPISGRLDTKTRKRASSLGLRVSSRPSAARRRRHPPIAGVCQQGETEHRAQSLNRLVEESLALALVGARQRGARIARTRPRRAAGACRPRANSTGRANLVRNAVEAIEQVERRELTIGTRAISQQAMVELTIADTGAGIAPELADRLFQPFVTTKATGMDLGLSICREIVEAHHGRLTTAPRPSGGCAAG
jgi:two-component system, LuxR family, sensor kinase FixL